MARLLKLLRPSYVPSNEEDAVLMERARQDDRMAFEALYDRYKKPVVGYLVQRVRGQARAEELAQDVFLKIYRARSSFDASKTFSSWLWTIVRNTAVDELRRKKEISFDVEEDGTTALDKIPSPLGDAETALLDKSSVEGLEKCVEALKPLEKEALMLKTFSELDYEAISEMLSRSVGAVKSLLHRARISLMDCLKRSAIRE